MKFRKIFLASVFLIAMLCLGAVSADDNLTATDDIQEEPVLSDDDYITVEVSPNDTLAYNEYCNVNIELKENTSGYVEYYLDEPYEYEEPYYFEGGGWISTGFSIQDFGEHTYHIKYYGGNHPDREFLFPYTVTDFHLSIYPINELTYGEDADFVLDIPDYAYGTLTVTFNGKKYSYHSSYGDEWVDEWPEEITIKREDIRYGENSVQLTFTPKDKSSDFRQKTVEKTFNATARIRMPDSLKYNAKENMTLILPQDAKGILRIQIDEKDNYTVELKNGTATFEIPTLPVGSHEFYAAFIGNYNIDPYSQYIGLSENVIVAYRLWVNETQEIIIETSNDGTYTAYLEGEAIASANATGGKATIPISLGEGYYDIEIEYDYHIIGDARFEVITESPDWQINVTDKEALKTYATLYIDNYPGYMSYDDEVQMFRLEIAGNEVPIIDYGSTINFDASKLNPGEYEYTLYFLGDGYYRPTQTSGKLTIDYMKLFAPEKVVFGDDSYEDWVSVYVPADATGKVTVSVNNKVLAQEELEEDSDDYKHVSFDLKKLNLAIDKTTAVEVKLISPKYPTTTKKFAVAASYALITDHDAIYGGSNISIATPDDIDTSKLSAKIDGINCEIFKTVVGDGEKYLYITTPKDLGIGNHTVEVTYPGDKRYPKLTYANPLEVYPEIQLEENLTKDGYVKLTLPGDAEGNLTVFVDGKQYATVRANGEAIITFENLSWGKYNINASYSADDYEVMENSWSITINPEITIPSKVLMGDKATVSISLDGISGYLNVWFDEFDQTVALSDGQATVELSGLTVGMNYIHINFEHVYMDEDSEEISDFYYWDTPLYVINPIAAKDTACIYSENSKYTVTIKDVNGNPVKSGTVTFYILDGKKQILKKTAAIKNGAATLTYKITQTPKTYTIKTVFKKASVSKKLTVKHVVALKSAAVKKSAKKLVLQATLSKVNKKYLKNKAVTFKFNGKTYRAKTNSKGVAKVTITKSVLSKLKVGKKVTYQATYLKDTVKKTVKVKK